MVPFERRVYSNIASVVLCFLPIILVAFVSLYRIVREERQFVSTAAQNLIQAERLRAIDMSLSSLVPIYILSGNAELIQEYDRRFQNFENLIAQFEKTESDAEIRSTLEQIAESERQARLAAAPGIEMRKRGATAATVDDYFKQHAAPISIRNHELLERVARAEQDSLAKAKDHLSETVNRVIASLGALCVLALALFAFIARLTMKMMRQKKENDETLERLAQARKEVVEVVAHDLKNPLGTIKMSLEMMTEETDATNIAAGLAIATRSADSMERLIRDLLDHAKIEAGQLVLERLPRNISELAHELVARYEPLAHAQQLNLIASIQHDLYADVDLGRMEQVISNLLGNALKFTRPNGRIFLSVTREENDVVIKVQDTGAGIDGEFLPHIFDRLWQVRETAKQGNGLGLAIAKAIVDAHGGRIWAESTKGIGSKFFVKIPRVDGPVKRIERSGDVFVQPQL